MGKTHGCNIIQRRRRPDCCRLVETASGMAVGCGRTSEGPRLSNRENPPQIQTGVCRLPEGDLCKVAVRGGDLRVKLAGTLKSGLSCLIPSTRIYQTFSPYRP